MATSTPPKARERPRRVADDPRYPAFIRWYLKLTRFPREVRVLRRMVVSTTGPHLLSAEEAGRLNEPLIEYLNESGRKLLVSGWTPFMLIANRTSEALDACTGLTENPLDGTIGFVLVTQGKKIGRMSATVGFRTDFTDGVRVLTSNSQATRRTPRMPRYEAIRLPEVHEADALYDIHRFRVAERARKVPAAFLTRGSDVLAFQKREAEETHAFWLSAGYFERVDGGGLRRTRRGAVLGVLRGMFPWKPLSDWRDNRETERILRRFRDRGSTGPKTN